MLLASDNGRNLSDAVFCDFANFDYPLIIVSFLIFLWPVLDLSLLADD